VTPGSMPDTTPEPDPPAPTDRSRSMADLEPDPKEEGFYAAALNRILYALGILTLAVSPLAFWRYGVGASIGFAVGGAVSWLNFRSLVAGVRGLADRIVNQQSRESGSIVVSRFLLRYLLVGAIAYGILKSSPIAFRGFLWGLTLPVAAMLIEAAYEGFVAFRR